MATKKRTKKPVAKKQKSSGSKAKVPTVAKKKAVKAAKKSAAKKAPAKKQKAAGGVMKTLMTAKAAAEPTGSCHYANTSGQPQCESPVTKAYCDGKNGQWVQDGSC
jgi:hypothetical protein